MIEFYYLFNIILFSRLIFTFRDEPISIKQISFISIIQVLGLLPFEFNFIFILLAFILLSINFSSWYLELKFDNFNLIRLLSFIFIIISLSIFFSPAIHLKFNESLLNFLQSLTRFSGFLNLWGTFNWADFSPILSGALLVTNEANILIRFLFQVFTLAPERKKESDRKIITIVDRRAYNAGRIIGVLERLLIYYFVLNNQFAAIGLIIAAKSFARFKDLEKREFAEYVLIGTLLSTLLAIFIAKLVQLM